MEEEADMVDVVLLILVSKIEMQIGVNSEICLKRYRVNSKLKSFMSLKSSFHKYLLL